MFKTSVRLKREARQLKPYLDKLLEQGSWNFDLEDRDKILRINSQLKVSEEVIKLLDDKGFACEELTD